MCSAIDNLSSCEMCAVIQFIQTLTRVFRKSIVNYARALYGQNVMSEGTIRQWCGRFEVRPTNVPDKERIVPVHSVDREICGRRRFTISEIMCEFLQISRIRLGYQKFCAR
jgi:hypothetical protein